MVQQDNLRAARKGSVLATKAVEMQGKDVVLAAKAVEEGTGNHHHLVGPVEPEQLSDLREAEEEKRPAMLL